MGESGLVLVSSDGVNWTKKYVHDNLNFYPSFLSVTWTGKRFFAVGVDGSNMVSPGLPDHPVPPGPDPHSEGG